jgi:superfamily II DNA/RNA helicase
MSPHRASARPSHSSRSVATAPTDPSRQNASDSRPGAPRSNDTERPSRAHGNASTKRGRNASRANATRSARQSAPTSNYPSNEPRTSKKATDLFATFDTGNEPNLDASFAELGVPASIVSALLEQGIDRPFPIQAATMADCLAGRDVLGRGRTGSGKTLAFVLPVLTRLAASGKERRAGRPRALVLVPTRELAIQIHTAITPLAKLLSLRACTVFGGVGPQPQINALRQGVDIVIACPGRLDDHIMSNYARLDAIEITVLDEADHMADMGFLPVVKKLLDQTPQNSQRLLFSATLDNGIDALVSRYLRNPILRSVDPVESNDVKMTHHVFAVKSDDRFNVLRDLAAAPGRIMIFTRTKHGAKKLTKTLVASGVPTVEMQGNLSQNIRTRNLELFRSGEATALVATDIAARGIHIDEVALVVHFDPPVDHKAYLHRSGRTARAGAEGTVITMMTESQTSEVKDLTRKAGITPTITRVTPEHAMLREVAPGERMFVEPTEIAQRTTPAPVSRPGRRAGAAANVHNNNNGNNNNNNNGGNRSASGSNGSRSRNARPAGAPTGARPSDARPTGAKASGSRTGNGNARPGGSANARTGGSAGGASAGSRPNRSDRTNRGSR